MWSDRWLESRREANNTDSASLVFDTSLCVFIEKKLQLPSCTTFFLRSAGIPPFSRFEFWYIVRRNLELVRKGWYIVASGIACEIYLVFEPTRQADEGEYCSQPDLRVLGWPPTFFSQHYVGWNVRWYSKSCMQKTTAKVVWGHLKSELIVGLRQTQAHAVLCKTQQSSSSELAHRHAREAPGTTTPMSLELVKSIKKAQYQTVGGHSKASFHLSTVN